MVNWVKSSRHTQQRWHYAECQEWQMWFKMSSPAFITPNAFFMNPPGSLSFFGFFFLLTWLPLSYTFCIVCCCCSLTVMSFWLAGEQEPLHQPPLSSPQLGESVPFPALLEITELLNHSNIGVRVTADISHWPPFKVSIEATLSSVVADRILLLPPHPPPAFISDTWNHHCQKCLRKSFHSRWRCGRVLLFPASRPDSLQRRFAALMSFSRGQEKHCYDVEVFWEIVFIILQPRALSKEVNTEEGNGTLVIEISTRNRADGVKCSWDFDSKS